MSKNQKSQPREKFTLPLRPLRLGTNLYALQTQPGFEQIALDEAVKRARARVLGSRVIPERSGIGIFTASASPALMKLRCAEDLFAVIGYHAAPDPSLEKISAAVRGTRHIDWALEARVRLMPGSRAGRRMRFRVIARMAGEHEFRRVDFKRTVERALAEREDRTWRLDEEQAEVEVWATLLDSEFIMMIRLSDDLMRQRGYKHADRPGSLRPAIAAALAWLSDPEPGDVVLDPFCGTATTLIERAHLGRYAMLLGGDNDPEALAVARINVGPRYKPIELRLWDAAALPLPDRSVTKIVTNLPWGIRFGSHSDNRHAYPRYISELNRVMAPGGKAVMLTGERALMRELTAARKIAPDRIIKVEILGTYAEIYVWPAIAKSGADRSA